MEIKKYIKTGLTLLAFSFLFAACKKDDGDDTIIDRPVVVAYLIAGEPINMNVYEQKGLLDTSSYGPIISGLNITISNGSKQVKLTQNTDGSYGSSDATIVTENATCTLNFDYNGKTISASTIVPKKPLNFSASAIIQDVKAPNPGDTTTFTFVPTVYNWTAQANGYYLIVFKNHSTTPYRIGSSFGMTRPYQHIEEYLGQVYTYKTQDRTFMFAGDYDVHLYHINSEYNTIINSSATSSLNLTNPETNVVNGLGIFTAMADAILPLNVYAVP